MDSRTRPILIVFLSPSFSLSESLSLLLCRLLTAHMCVIHGFEVISLNGVCFDLKKKKCLHLSIDTAKIYAIPSLFESKLMTEPSKWPRFVWHILFHSKSHCPFDDRNVSLAYRSETKVEWAHIVSWNETEIGRKKNKPVDVIAHSCSYRLLFKCWIKFK